MGRRNYTVTEGRPRLPDLGGINGLAVDRAGNIYVGDSPPSGAYGRVRVVSPGAIINSIAGGGASLSAFCQSGLMNCLLSSPPATDVGITPYHVALGSGGSIYFSDQDSGAVWLLTPSSTPVFPLPYAVSSNSASGFPATAGSVPTSIAIGGWIEIYGSYPLSTHGRGQPPTSTV